MTTLPTPSTRIALNLDTLPAGIRRKLGSVTTGTVEQVTWNGRIGVKVDGSTGTIWVEAMDVTEVTNGR